MKRLWSVFTDDMEHCYFTGAAPVERHHIFPGNPNRKNSEKYGFHTASPGSASEWNAGGEECR